jgi:hypothetical protein
MALSRPFVLAVLGALLAVATFASMRAAGQRAEADQTPAAPKVVALPRPGATKPLTKHAGTSAPAHAKAAPAAGANTKAQAKPQTAKAAPAKKAPAAPKGVPPKVARALQAHKTVVLFFRQPGADDDATASAVRSIKSGRHVTVFTDRITHLGRYQRVVADLGISQAPAIVVVGRSHKATLLEGFVDEGSLKQRVKDAE